MPLPNVVLHGWVILGASAVIKIFATLNAVNFIFPALWRPWQRLFFSKLPVHPPKRKNGLPCCPLQPYPFFAAVHPHIVVPADQRTKHTRKNIIFLQLKPAATVEKTSAKTVLNNDFSVFLLKCILSSTTQILSSSYFKTVHFTFGRSTSENCFSNAQFRLIMRKSGEELNSKG